MKILVASGVCVFLTACVLPLLGQTDHTSALEQPIVPKDTERIIVGLENQVLQGYLQKNREAVAPLLAGDFQDVGEYGIWDKERSLQDIADPSSTTQSSAMNEVHFSRLAPSVVLLTYRLDEVDLEHGKPAPSAKYISSVWVQREGKWLNVLGHDTPAAGGSPPAVAVDAVSSQDDAAVLKEILSSEDRIVATLSHDDIDGFAKLLPDDVVDIDDDGIHTKAQWIPEMLEQKNMGYLFRDFRFEEPRLIRLGPDQATFTAKEIIRGLNKGRPFELRYYTNATYVRRSGKWVPRVYQDTPMVK